jgi:DNA processing protein
MLGRAVAVVGARAPTVYGLETARRLGHALASAGVVVVSGLARGIDAAAHRAALEAGGLTLAFSACGPDQIYPREHADLAAQIAASGAVVTEMPPETPPLPQYFPLRNRLISGVSEIVIVVEGRLKSGSLVTARKALDQGREVMAVPGPIGAPTSAGPNRLLWDGASPMTEIADVFRMLDLPMPETGERSKRDRPGPAARRVIASLRREPATRDELAGRLGMPKGELALELMELELSGRVATDRDGRLRLVGTR